VRDRFKLVGHLEPYDADDLALVALTYAGGATSSWTFRDHSYEVTGQLDELIDPETARQSLEYNDVDEHGLEQRDHRYLECLVREYLGGPVGLARLAGTLAMAIRELTDDIEPYLMSSGLLSGPSNGRCATAPLPRHAACSGYRCRRS
jgi:Holliday junction resolvasome RuvABC ATP-dependent DNA helicase subunit